MIRLTAFAASAALLLAVVTTGSVLNSEAKSPDAIDLCAHAEAETAGRGACTPSSPAGVPLTSITPGTTVLLDACAGGDLHVVRYGGAAGEPVVATFCQAHR